MYVVRCGLLCLSYCTQFQLNAHAQSHLCVRGFALIDFMSTVMFTIERMSVHLFVRLMNFHATRTFAIVIDDWKVTVLFM